MTNVRFSQQHPISENAVFLEGATDRKSTPVFHRLPGAPVVVHRIVIA